MSAGSRDQRSGWLDSLARWSVAGRGNAHAPSVGGDASQLAGTTRRTALRAAAGAGTVAIFAPLRLLGPSSAAAATTRLAECKSESNEKAYADAENCLRNPRQEFLSASDFVDQAKRQLRLAKSPAERRRLRKVIDFQERRRREALRDMGFCNKSFLSDRAEGDAKCESASTPAGGETGGSGTGPNGGCDPGYVFCFDHCCDTSNAYCQSCPEKVICCRIDASCCPSG
jgi:hypothetical protein